MADLKHTPGPWEMWRGAKYVGGGEDICIGSGTDWIANMDHRFTRCPDVTAVDGHPGDWSARECPICTIDAPEISAEQEANARLIAAAPDLLAVVERLGEWLDNRGALMGGETGEVREQVRAVIAKATEAPHG